MLFLWRTSYDSPVLTRRRFALTLLPAVAVVLLYLPTLGYGFLNYDDRPFILSQEFWSEPSWACLAECFTQPFVGHYHPLLWASLLIERVVWGPSAFGLRLSQLLAFAGCAVLLVVVSRRLGLSERTALLAGLIFGLHPAHVESVVWISARAGPFAMLPALGALVFYLGADPDRPLGPRRGLSIASLFLIAVAMKSTVAIALLPCLVLAAWDRGRRRDIGWLLLYSVMGLGWLAINALTYEGGVTAGIEVSLPERLRTTTHALAWYVQHTWLPYPLAPSPEAPALAGGPELRDALALGMIVFAWGAVAFAYRKGWRRPVPLAVVFFAVLLPVAGLVPFNHFVQDRYLLAPVAAFAIGAAEGLVRLARIPRNRVVVWALIGGLALSVFYGRRYARAWHDDLSLREWAWRVQPTRETEEEVLVEGCNSPSPEVRARAIATVLSMVRQGSDSRTLHMLAGSALREEGDLEQAVVHFQAVLRVRWNQRYLAGFQLIDIAVQTGRLDLGTKTLVEIEPEVPRVGRHMLGILRGDLHVARGNLDAAVVAYKGVLSGRPSSDRAWLGLAHAARKRGKPGEARAALERVRDPSACLAFQAHLALDEGDAVACAEHLAGLGGRKTREVGLAEIRLVLLRKGPEAARVALARFLEMAGPGARLLAREEADLRPLLQE